MLTLPGLIDVHVHLRTPGQTHKEDLHTGTSAALAGGFTCLLDMPNTTPPTTDATQLAAKEALIETCALCDVKPFVGGTATNVGKVWRLARRAVGLKLYLEETHGPLLLPDLAIAMTHLRRWPGVVAVHATGWRLAAAIGLAQMFNRALHCCHVARQTDITLIRLAKERGAPVTCEVTPHHLFLTAADARRLGPLAYMKPTLGTASDRDALWANLDVVDCIASDHAPHTLAEKRSQNPPPGVPGLETTLPLLLTAIHEGRLSLERMVELLHKGPRRVYALPPQPETRVEIDPDADMVLGEEPLHTRCGWTPFAGMHVWGRVRRVILRGQLRYADGHVLLPPARHHPPSRNADADMTRSCH